MSESYIGEIRIFGFNFAPLDWAFCDGGTLSITQYTALFSILGTSYGGNGQTNFNLPNFQGSTGIHQGQGQGLSRYVVGQAGGAATVTLTQGQMPLHNHQINTLRNETTTQDRSAPTSTTYLGGSTPDQVYNDAIPTPATPFATNAISVTGQSLPHDNLQPYQVLNFCISLYGSFPPHGD